MRNLSHIIQKIKKNQLTSMKIRDIIQSRKLIKRFIKKYRKKGKIKHYFFSVNGKTFYQNLAVEQMSSLLHFSHNVTSSLMQGST